MHGILQNVPRTKVFLDDTIVFSQDFEQRQEELFRVFQLLSDNNLHISVKNGSRF